ncbi:hypothetical protein T439DRAFT_330212 [Meredithblackwellia eburnea MCA 4105]
MGSAYPTSRFARTAKPTQLFTIFTAVCVLFLIIKTAPSLTGDPDGSPDDNVLQRSFHNLRQTVWSVRTPTAPSDSSSRSSTKGVGKNSNSAPPTCDFCLLEPEDDKCKYGRDNIRLSRAYDGSGFRMRKMLEKAIRGEPIGIGVLGASVTYGHAMPNGATKWQDQFLKDFVELFPKTTMHVGAVPAMDSNFFSYCYGTQVPTDLDLYIIELDINNIPREQTFVDDDALHRSLLSLPQEPAVMRVSVFSVAFLELARGYSSALALSHWHDIPIIGIRNWLLPHVMHHPETLPDFFGIDETGGVDHRHIGQSSHIALGDMLALYMREQLCETKRQLEGVGVAKPANDSIWPKGTELGLPAPKYIWKHFHQPPLVQAKVLPTCQLTNSFTHPMNPTHVIGNWTMIEWKHKLAFFSESPGSAAAFSFNGSKVGVWIWETGVNSKFFAGQAMCWIDAARENAKFINARTKRDADGPELIILAEGLEEGPHYVTCEVLPHTSTGGHDFRLMGIAAT